MTARRALFHFLDFVSTTLISIGAGFAGVLAVSTGWNEWVAMFVAMAAGMVVLGVGLLAMGYFVTSFSVFTGGMIASMITSMIGGMEKAHGDADYIHVLLMGLAVGVATQTAITLADMAMYGEVKRR